MPRTPRATSHPAASRLSLPVAALVLSACAARPLPDPRAAAQRWVEAVRSGDEATVYALLTEADQRALGREQVSRLLQSEREEALALAQAAVGNNAALETSAEIRLEGDRSARVVLEGGEFHVAAAGALPAGAASPRAALRELRDVLAQRSFAGLLRVLTTGSARSLEGGLQRLVEALSQPSAVELDVEGRRATAQLPGGHTVTLEREDGIWRVKDFD